MQLPAVLMDMVYSILDPAHDLEAHAQVPVLGAHALYGFSGQTQGHGALTPINTHTGERYQLQEL